MICSRRCVSTALPMSPRFRSRCSKSTAPSACSGTTRCRRSRGRIIACGFWIEKQTDSLQELFEGMIGMNAGRCDDESSLQRILRALRHRNYRLFHGGQSVSLIGTRLTRVASSWLVYRLMESARRDCRDWASPMFSRKIGRFAVGVKWEKSKSRSASISTNCGMKKVSPLTGHPAAEAQAIGRHAECRRKRQPNTPAGMHAHEHAHQNRNEQPHHHHTNAQSVSLSPVPLLAERRKGLKNKLVGEWAIFAE